MSQINRLSAFSAGILVLIANLALPLQAQTQASCTFTYFNAPSGYSSGFFPYGINHYDTIVGSAQGSGNTGKGFIRYSGGGLRLFAFPGAAWTTLNRRNLNGVSVGTYGSGLASLPPGFGAKGFILTSNSIATLNYPGAGGTALTGINKWNVIVGNAVNPTTTREFGFKYQSGNFTKIMFPGSVQTSVTGINDNGVIVGGYEMNSSEDPWFGYVLQNGTYKSLNYGSNIWPADINNSGTIVDSQSIHFTSGAVKTVSVPYATESYIGGINDLGTITGGAAFNATTNPTWKGYTAVCH